MNQSPQQTDPASKGSAILHEDDIGSGEKTPAQKETDELIKEIPPLKGTNGSDQGSKG